MAGLRSFLFLYTFLSCSSFSVAHVPFGVRDNLHFSVEARQFNKDGSIPTYKNPKASIEARINDLLPRMTLAEKVSQLWVIQICAMVITQVVDGHSGYKATSMVG